MTDVKIQYGAFKKLVRQNSLIVFECKDCLMTSLGPLTLWAEKRNQSSRVYPDSIPYLKVGYISISGSEVEKLPKNLMTDIEEMNEIINTISPEDLSGFVEAVLRGFGELRETGLRAEVEEGFRMWRNPEEGWKS